MDLYLELPAILFSVFPYPISKKFGMACHLVLAVVGTPATTAVVASTAVAAAESAVVAVATLLVLLVSAALLVTQSAKPILTVSTKVAWVTAESLLVGLLLVQALSTLARSSLSG